MARIELTAKAIEKAKPASAGNRKRLWDSLVPSMALMVTDKGHKSFVIMRRVNGRSVTTTLGEYPALTLEKARERARSAIDDLRRGRDPRQTQVKVAAASRRHDSFEAAVERYIKEEVNRLERRDGKLVHARRPRTREEISRPLLKFFKPKWGTLSLSEITKEHIRDAFREMIDAGAPVQANRSRTILRAFFEWAVDHDLIAAYPTGAIWKRTDETPRERVLTDAELRALWSGADALGWPFGSFVKALILTGARRNEVAGMTWAEIDLQALTWSIPAARTKNGREHVVAISGPLARLLNAAARFGDNDTAPVFTGGTRKRKAGKPALPAPISGFSDGKDRLDDLITKARDGKPLARWTLHDLRRTCATGMGNLGVAPPVIEAALNHASGFRAGVAGIYQRQQYEAERRAAFELWGAHVESLQSPLTGNVVSIRGRPANA